ncbi:MAG: xanthine dehydrogenase family protein subunit M [Chloroflexi bacterium]|nr:xanthine dehydrogenase family protein subunit M [Chloroflexota bacterium]MCY3583456.1 xanthine dehydrogenase family protein subunit M [Chloroflexota bacterium]MCY3716811.1 xanthine dehydrogenase family protein subunit M [Chloroflexota bacterium]MDE2650336.1 xanthine dehydrogenase family protein subunit M [Chloroflexota bacterium]MXX83623.1 xanthine dehydrogenase family protein subunit M [Chloroflexota bacterium]
MWPQQFDYQRADSIEGALAAIGEDGKFLAGGHSLLPAMKLRLSTPEQLVDIGHIPELQGISASGGLTIGAATTHDAIASSADVQSVCAALASACGQVGDQAVRNFGTLGGNIAHADPASDPPTVLVACGATIHIQGADGSRSVGAEDFFLDLFETDLQDGELITSISLPDCSDCQCAYVKLPHPASRYAIVGVAVCLKMDGETCAQADVAVGGATVKAVKCAGAEAALVGSSLDDAAMSAAAAALSDDIGEWLAGDVAYPEAYRSAMAGVFLKRAINAARG